MTIIRTKKYSALEILEMAFPTGIDIVEEGAEAVHVAPADAFGKYGITIGGIAGITDPERKIIVDGVEPVQVLVGNVEASVPVVEE